MPHVIVKALPGKTEEQKARIAEAISRDVMEIFGNDENAISISIEDVAPDRWKDDVSLPDIKGRISAIAFPTAMTGPSSVSLFSPIGTSSCRPIRRGKRYQLNTDPSGELRSAMRRASRSPTTADPSASTRCMRFSVCRCQESTGRPRIERGG